MAENEKTIVIDGRNAVLGRLASYTAKHLLKGDAISITNCRNIIITGRKNDITGKYLARRGRGSPHHGPFFPKNPDAIVRRTIRGMLPKTKKGRASLKKLRVYQDSPEKRGEPVSFAVKDINTNFITVGELSKIIGGK